MQETMQSPVSRKTLCAWLEDRYGISMNVRTNDGNVLTLYNDTLFPEISVLFVGDAEKFNDTVEICGMYDKKAHEFRFVSDRLASVADGISDMERWTDPHTMFDLGYTLISSGADSFAPEDGSNRRRGLGSGYIATLRFPTLEPTATYIPGVKIGDSDSDFFSGADCSYISNPSGKSGRLGGGYGQIFNISVPIKNTTSSARKFRIFIGSNGGNSYPFVLYGNSIASYTASAPHHQYVDVIETDYIASNATTTVTFQTVITALASAPYVIGARIV